MPVEPQQIESLFIRAAEIFSPADRQMFLDEQCGGDVALRQRVEALLRAHDDAGSFLDRPPEDVLPTIAVDGRDTVDESLMSTSLEFLSPCETPDRLGALGQYEVMEILGRGGMGIVLRAHDTKLNRVVAIKVMAPELAANPMAVKRFLREAEAAAAVTHDHVVSIHAIEDEVSPPYIVMEFVDGLSLQEKLDKHGALELREILRIGMQASAGLAAAHRQGLVHRDIKPANILLENGVERVKLTDFGLARAVDDVNITRTGIIAGTPQYMSPEQAEGKIIDHRSDLFALGSVLYAMCTGRPAFRADNPMAVMRRVCDDQPRPILEINADVPDWLCAIIEKLLEKDAGDRFQTAEEVSELLANWLAHVQQPALVPAPEIILRAGSVGPLKPAGNMKKVGARSSGKHIQPADAGRSPKWPLIVTAAALLLGIIALGALIMIATDRGVLEVRSEVGDVQISVTKEGEEVAVLDVATGSKVKWLASDDYQIKLVGDDNDIRLDKSGFELSRLGKVIVTARWRDDDAGVIKRFAGDEETITQDGIEAAEGGWKVTADKTRTVRLFEVPMPEMKPGQFFYKAKLKTENVKDRAFLEMWVRLPGQGEFFSKGFHNAIKGDNGWTEYEIPFRLEPGQQPNLAKLNIVIEGGGTVWVKDVELRGRTVLPSDSIPSESEVQVLIGDAVLVLNFNKESFYQREGKTFVRDVSGNGHDARLQDARFTDDGRAGGAVQIDGGDPLAERPIDEAGGLYVDDGLTPSGKPFTIAGWIWLGETPEGQRRFAQVFHNLSKDDGAGFGTALDRSHDFAMTLAFPKDGLKQGDPGHQAIYGSPARTWDFAEGRWGFIAISREPEGVVRLTCDGETEEHKSKPGGNAAIPAKSVIGRWFNGRMDEFVVLDRALSAEEVNKLYRWGMAGRSLPKPNQ